MYVIIPILTIIGLALLVFIILLIVLYDRGILSGKKKYPTVSEEDTISTVQELPHQNFINEMSETTHSQNRAATTYKTTDNYEDTKTNSVTKTELNYAQLYNYKEQEELMRFQQRNIDELYQHIATHMNDTLN